MSFLRWPEETQFFARIAVFAIVVAVAYWFISYEWAGTVLLVGLALATGAIGLRLLWAGRRRTRTEPPGGPATERDAGTPFLDESGRLPAGSLAPFGIGLGVAIAATGLVFGPWFALAGIVPLGLGAWAWLTEAASELDATVAIGQERPGPVQERPGPGEDAAGSASVEPVGDGS